MAIPPVAPEQGRRLPDAERLCNARKSVACLRSREGSIFVHPALPSAIQFVVPKQGCLPNSRRLCNIGGSIARFSHSREWGNFVHPALPSTIRTRFVVVVVVVVQAIRTKW